MTNDLHDDERAWRRRLAELGEEPADAAFVERVHRRVSRHRLVSRMGRIGTGVVLAGCAVVLTPVISSAAAWAATAPVTYAPQLEGLLLSPLGLAASAAVGAVTLLQFVRD